MARSSCKMIGMWTKEFIGGSLMAHSVEIGENVPSKYATTSNVRYDEEMHYDVTCT